MEIGVHGDLPQGSGLSSSAALEMAVATLVESVNGRQMSNRDKIHLCQRAEHRYAAVPCGILDQFCVAMAQDHQLLLLDCQRQEADSIPVAEGSICFLVVDSAVCRELNDGAYALRRQECEQAAQALSTSLRNATLAHVERVGGSVLQRRARHVISENQRVHEMADAVAKGQWQRAGSLMDASHRSLRDDFQVSCPEVDLLVELAQMDGAIFGARMTGGGFGGSVVALVARDSVAGSARTLVDRYHDATGLDAKWMQVEPVAGARAISLDQRGEGRA
jgi:galactokinase